MPCKTRPAQTAFDALRQLPQPLSVWLTGLSQLARRLRERDADCTGEFDGVREEIGQAVEYLEQEAEISPRVPAAEALAVMFEHFPDLRGRFAVAVAKADQALGRAELLAQFSAEG